MTTNDDYPWSGSPTQITAFVALDDALVAYAKWKLSPAFGEKTEQDLREREFLAECSKGSKQIKRRLDLTADSGYGMELE